MALAVLKRLWLLRNLAVEVLVPDFFFFFFFRSYVLRSED